MVEVIKNPVYLVDGEKLLTGSPIEQKAELEYLPMACKPLPFKYLKAIKMLKATKKTTAIVGDQIFTDIMGGRLSGVKTILVTDITPEDKLNFKVKRSLEKKLLKRWKK